MDGVADQVGEDLLHGGRVAPCRRQFAHDDLGLLVADRVVQRIDDLLDDRRDHRSTAI